MENDSSARRERRLERAFGVIDLVTAALLVGGVFGGLQQRWWVVDGSAVVLSLAELAAGVGLVTRASWGRQFAWRASALLVGAALVLVIALAYGAGVINGVYGATGRRGVVMLLTAAAVGLPYLMFFPVLELVWLGPPARKTVGETP